MMISDNDIIRMNRSTFDKLVCHLSPKLLVGNKGGKMKLSIEKQLLIYIKYASSQQTLTEISDTYGVCEGTAHCIIHRTSSLICADMLSNLITWPSLSAHTNKPCKPSNRTSREFGQFDERVLV